MRIGIDARLRAYRAGGISEHVTRLIEGFAALDPPEEIVAFEHRKAARSPTGLDTRRLFTPPHHRFEGLLLPIELVPARLDLWHAVDVVVPRLWAGRSVATVHDVAFLRRPELVTDESRRYYGRVHDSVSRADRVIVVSEYTRSELETLTDVDPARIRVVANSIHPRYFETGDEERDGRVRRGYDLPAGFLLFVSTIEPRKNVTTLLTALRRMLDDGIDVTLALAGSDGWRSDRVYSMAEELRLGDRARFLGYVPDDDLAALYRGARVVAHPALDEGFGLTPLEAMAAGTPVVVSSAGSLPEVVGDAAQLVAPDDADAWAAVLSRTIADAGSRLGYADAGRSRAAQFTVERMAKATLSVYREAAAGAGAGAAAGAGAGAA